MLLDHYEHPCVKLVQAQIADGEGGWNTEWLEDVSFDCYRISLSSSEAEKAEQAVASDTYKVMAARSVPLEFGDYYRENDSGDVYRVTSTVGAVYSPDSSSVPVNSFTVERRDLPT